jgi:hypothetical protein
MRVAVDRGQRLAAVGGGGDGVMAPAGPIWAQTGRIHIGNFGFSTVLPTSLDPLGFPQREGA